MSLQGAHFMDDPAVNAALQSLADAIEAAANARGLHYKAIAVVGHTLEVRGIAMTGCDCDSCCRAMAVSLQRAVNSAAADGAVH